MFRDQIPLSTVFERNYDYIAGGKTIKKTFAVCDRDWYLEALNLWIPAEQIIFGLAVWLLFWCAHLRAGRDRYRLPVLLYGGTVCGESQDGGGTGGIFAGRGIFSGGTGGWSGFKRDRPVGEGEGRDAGGCSRGLYLGRGKRRTGGEIPESFMLP